MNTHTRSRRITKAIATVLHRMPSEPRQVIKDYVSGISARNEYGIAIVGFEPEPAMISVGSSAHITFVLPVCRLLSDRALLGVVAKQFGHALDAERMSKEGRFHYAPWSALRYTAAESFASSWGFSKEIRAMRDEWGRVRVALRDRLAKGQLPNAAMRRADAQNRAMRLAAIRASRPRQRRVPSTRTRG